MSFFNYTYTFTNGTTADATQVNQNFSDVKNGFTDGTHDANVNALTAAGTATLNGSVVLGNSATPTVTWNASLASSIPIGTNTTYDIGSATLGLRSVYIGGTSTFTTRIESQATASWTFNLPATAGSNGQVMMTDGSGNMSMASISGSTTILKSPTFQTFTSTGSTAGWLFTISTSTTCAVNDTYQDPNGHQWAVVAALSAQSGQVLWMQGATTPTGALTLTRTAGSGTSSITYTAKVAWATYTLPTGPSPIYIRIRMVGGGGGGGGTGTGPGSAGAGLTTGFGANILFGNGGSAGQAAAGFTAGGTASIGGTATGIAISGGSGTGSNTVSSGAGNGGPGGTSALGGSGGGGQGGHTDGGAAAANSGSGGGGAGAVAAGSGGSGGGAGGLVDAIITSPSGQTQLAGGGFPYVVGTGGAGATLGTGGSNGGNGAAGVIFVEEHYQ